MIDKAVLMYQRMITDGISADNVTYFTIIQGCIYQDKQDFALNLLLEAIHHQK